MLKFQQFTKNHYPNYHSWFQNKALTEALSYIDEEWLTPVTTQTDGVDYAVLRGEELVGVVGIALPPPASDLPHAITNIAVEPGQTQMGIGSAILAQLPAALNLTNGQ